MSRPKQQGTRLEPAIVNELKDVGLYAVRLPEGGSNDRGDILVELGDDTELVVEAKARQALGIHAAVAKADRKAGAFPAVVWWKRLIKPADGGRRRAVDGQAEVVAMSKDTFVWLLNRGN